MEVCQGKSLMNVPRTNCTNWQIDHHIASPNHLNSNGEAEAGVKIAKQMMIKWVERKSDLYEALLEFRNTPKAHTGLSPHVFSTCKNSNSKRRKNYYTKLKTNGAKTSPQIIQYNKKAKRKLSNLEKGDNLYFEQKKNKWIPGKVNERINDRNYIVVSENTLYKKNRDHMRKTGVNVKVRDMSPPRNEISENTKQDQIINNENNIRINKNDNQNQPSSNQINLRPRREIKTSAYLKDYVRH